MKKLFTLLGILVFSLSLSGCKTEHKHTLIRHEAKEATCTETGHNAYEECSECDYTTYAKIDALGHNHKSVVTEPTCEEKGYTTYSCECGDTYISNYVNALGHNHKSVVTEPTCVEKGYTTYTCECGNTYISDYVNALGHNHKSEVTEPTCEEQGYTTYTCECGDTYISDYVDALGHKGIVGCTGTICNICGDKFDETVNQDIHVSYDENTGKCECGKSITPQAKTGNLYYEAFDIAIENWTDGTTLMLLADITNGTVNESIRIIDKTVTLDLNGYTLDMSSVTTAIEIGECGNLTIRDIGENGTLKGSTNSVTVYGEFNLESGNLASRIFNTGTVNMIGGNITTSHNAIENDGILHISSGTLDGLYGIWNRGTTHIFGSPEIAGENCAIVNFDDMTISDTPIFNGRSSFGQIGAYAPITFYTQPADGTTWSVCMEANDITENHGVFAIPGDGVTLDVSKFISKVGGYEVKQNAKGELLLCNHQVAYVTVSNNDGSTHKMLCYCGETTIEESVACSGGFATCQNKAVCSTCGQSYGEINADIHSFDVDGKCICGAERGEAVNIDLSTLTETYVINDSGEYIFTGTGNYGIKVESGTPKIVLNNASILLTDGDYYDNPINGIHIVTAGGTTEIFVIGENSITAKAGAGIFIAEGGTVKITGSSREDVLTSAGAYGGSGIGGYAYLVDHSDPFCINCGNIEISNVTVKAFGSESGMGDLSPAIGGAGNGNCGYITIDNADAYAEGVLTPFGGSSAIGTGVDAFFLDGGTIGEISIINNSNVYVTRGNYCDYIGCSGNEIEPTEGVVNATVDDTSEVIKQN